MTDTIDRRALCMAVVTLDGERAAITGRRNEFATVTAVKSGVYFTWAWATVARIVAAGGKFQS